MIDRAKEENILDTSLVTNAQGMTVGYIASSKEYKVINGTSYDARTPYGLCDVLERLREKGRTPNARVVLVYGNVETGEVWEDATPMRGTIGRSMGSVKIPLLIRTRRSFGGEGILDHCILSVRASVGGACYYEHPILNRPKRDPSLAHVREEMRASK
jgi:hypothetical protein